MFVRPGRLDSSKTNLISAGPQRAILCSNINYKRIALGVLGPGSLSESLIRQALAVTCAHRRIEALDKVIYELCGFMAHFIDPTPPHLNSQYPCLLCSVQASIVVVVVVR